MNWTVGLIVAFSTLSLWVGCSKAKDKSDESSEEVDGAGTLELTSNLAASYPQGLSVTAFPQAVDETPGTAAAGTVLLLTEGTSSLLAPCPPPPEPLVDGCTPPNNNDNQQDEEDFEPFAEHPKQRLEDAKQRLEGAASECFDSDIIAAMFRDVNLADACYGFDYGMVSGTALGDVDPGKINPALQGLGDQSLASIKAALLGIEGITTDTNVEACMVKVGRQMVDKAAGRVEGTLRVFEGMLCQAKKDALATKLPEIGESLDLKAAFDGYDRATFSAASISRLDDKDGRPVYRSHLAFVPNGGPAEGKEMSVTLVHSPSADNNVEYDGVMWFQGERAGQGQTGNYTVVTSITYAKTGTGATDQRLRMELRNAEFNRDKVTSELVSSDGTIDLNPGVDDQGSFGAGNQNDYVEGLRYFAFDINPSSYAGNISFWNNPGGGYGESARGFLFESTQADDGTLSGCAYSGAVRDVSIRKAIREDLVLEPTGCFTPQLDQGEACGNGTNNVGTQIWKQCFKQEDDGYYVVDTANVTSAEGFDIIDLGGSSAPTLPVVAPPPPGARGPVRD